jgi:hypothetical protein
VSNFTPRGWKATRKLPIMRLYRHFTVKESTSGYTLEDRASRERLRMFKHDFILLNERGWRRV